MRYCETSMVWEGLVEVAESRGSGRARHRVVLFAPTFSVGSAWTPCHGRSGGFSDS